MTIILHHGDLAAGFSPGEAVAVDTEAMGLHLHRDRLCLVQLCAGDGVAHLVRLDRHDYHAPKLRAVLEDPSVEKIFHFARFDVAMLEKWLGACVRPVYCTKIASKLARTFTDRHGLRDLARDLLGVELSKQQQSSDWGADALSPDQQHYAAQDVLHLHALKEKLDMMLEREKRASLARRCFEFIPARARLDLEGWPELDIFAH